MILCRPTGRCDSRENAMSGDPDDTSGVQGSDKVDPSGLLSCQVGAAGIDEALKDINRRKLRRCIARCKELRG